MTTLENLATREFASVATGVMRRLLALVARWREAGRAARQARIQRVIDKGHLAIE